MLMGALPLGSRERMMISVARALMAAGHRVDLLVPGSSPHWREAVPEGARLLELGRGFVDRLRNKQRLALCVPLIARYLRRECPDVLFTMSIPPNLAGLAAGRLAGSRVPVVIRQSNVVHLASSEAYRNVRARRRDRLIPLLYPSAEGAIAVSHGVADNLQRVTTLPAERIRVIYNQVVGPELQERAAEPVECSWLEDAEVPVLLAVGRLVTKKDYPTLLRTLARLRQRMGEVRLIILGEGDQRSHLEALRSELGLEQAVALPGRIDNPFAWMARADLLVLSSISEGMPSVLIEAMACGCPVVATDCPAGPAEILGQGRYGRLVPVGDEPALADAIEATLCEPVNGALLAQRADDFSVGGAINQYVEVLLARPR
ncbi:glycosyltransferase involved in cell wall biosynthesis [Kushneria sinocarnis]|uniref:Glycosyltransferase involved in cell wall biosynthesis n=2 Tax=Kushneria sinocarnis TaxID=595502 RepID=A0A420WTI5_9GAMM|nr:glycosyltransferase involved in cell wall biosynthesis [Kushneria sinocarnis]